MAATCDDTEIDLDALCALVLNDTYERMIKDEQEEEEEERRKREPGGKGKKRKTAIKKKAETTASKVGKAEASSRPSAARAEAAARVKKSDGEAELPASRKKVEIDFAAAAVYRAKAEEAHRKQQRKEEFAAADKWIATGDPEAKKYWKQRMAEEMEKVRLSEEDPTEDLSDLNALAAQRYRVFWNNVWAPSFGSFEDTTPIRPMRYTDKPQPDRTRPMETLQLYSVRVARIVQKEGIEWPLDVYGIVAARDCLDRNRNIIFERKRDNCQTITKENPYLTLTGPTRAVVVVDPACFEVALRVRGATESDDKDLSSLIVWHVNGGTGSSRVNNRVETSKLSTLELMFAQMGRSVEATISVRVVSARRPDCGFRGEFSASTSSIDDMKVSLLAFGDDNKLPVADDGTIQLSRRVVCVELEGELRVSVMAQCDEGQVVERDSEVFKPKEASRSYAMLEVCSCKMEVTIAWSLLSDSLYLGGSACTDI